MDLGEVNDRCHEGRDGRSAEFYRDVYEASREALSMRAQYFRNKAEKMVEMMTQIEFFVE